MLMRLARLLRVLPLLFAMPRLDGATVLALLQAMSESLRHDLRSAPSAILSLVGLYWAGALEAELLARQVASHAREALMYVDELSCVTDEAMHCYRMSGTDLAELIALAADEIWPLAKDAHVALQRMACPGPVWVNADGPMLTRLLVCLLRRAMALTRPGGKVRIGIGAAAGRYCAEVAFIAGRGGGTEVLDESNSVGLLAGRVMKRHGGAAVVHVDGAMTAWRLILPRAAAPGKKAPEGAFLPSDR